MSHLVMRLYQGSIIPSIRRAAIPPSPEGDGPLAAFLWIERQGYVYQAIVVMPETHAASADAARFLGSLEAVPIADEPAG
jgi:hypothetical protein